MSIFKKHPIFPTVLFLTLAFVVSGCAKPAVMMTSAHGLGMESMERLTLLGSPKPSKDKDALCCSGDLDKIMASTSLDQDQQRELHSFICGGRDSIKAFCDFYHGLPDNQRLQLKGAFAALGYHI